MRNSLRTLAGTVALALLALGLWHHLEATSESPRSEQPNIVLLIIDTLPARLLGCYGAGNNPSPEIDALAREGVLFENVLAQCSWTRPSIASLLTALYPRTVGIYKERYDILSDRYLTLAEILQRNGYRTIGVTANPNINKVFGFGQGFDEYSESSVLFSWMRPEPGKTFQPLGKFPDLPRSRQIFEWVLRRAASTHRPTYVQIDIMEVHTPDLIRNEFKKLSPENAGATDRPPGIVWKTQLAVRQVSHDTGLFVKRLSSLRGWENTLFLITSDHGQGLTDHPNVPQSSHHGNLLYESELRVPLVLYNPAGLENLSPGGRLQTRVRLLDLMPTILDYAKLPVPDGLAGTSLLPLLTLTRKPPPLPDVFVAESNWRNVNKIAAYGRKWAYIENRDGWKGVNRYELQRLGTTANGTLTDQIASHPKAATRLRAALARWEARFPKTGPTSPAVNPSDAEREQLRSLGYAH